MKGIIRRATAAGLAAAAVAGCQGTAGERPGATERLRNVYDPCWPERYNAVARQEVLAPFAAQAVNGQIVDATLWNYLFEPGGERLTPAGQDKLEYLIHRRPGPEPRLYVQTAKDLAFNVDTADDLPRLRRELDAKRAASIQRYVALQTADRPAAVDVQVIDAVDPGFSARYPINAVRLLPTQYVPGLGVSAAAGNTAAGGTGVGNVNFGGGSGGTPGGAGGTGAGATGGGGGTGR